MIYIEQIFFSILIGIVQGVTEWLPISISRTLILSQHLLGLDYNPADTFYLFLAISTAFAAVFYFRKDVLSVLKVLIGKGSPEGWMLLKFLFITYIFSGIIAAPLLFLIYFHIIGNYSIGLPMMILGIILFLYAFVIWYRKSKYTDEKNRRPLSDMKFRDFAIVGMAQGLAVLPGMSKSV